MGEQQTGTGNIFDVSKERLPGYVRVFAVFSILAIVFALATTPYISFSDFIFAVFSKIASSAATFATLSAVWEVFYMSAVKKYIDNQKREAEKRGYERAAKIAKDRGVQLPPYESDRDAKDGNSPKSRK